MAILDVLQFPDERLRTVAKPVDTIDSTIKTLVSDMLDTMKDENGIGLAATQVDVHKRVVVIDVSEKQDTPQVFINAEITQSVKKAVYQYPITMQKLNVLRMLRLKR